MAISGRVLRINLTAFVTDLSLYLIWTAVPFKAISLGATPAVLGVLPAVSSLTYVLTTIVAGRLSDRLSRLGLARAGAFVFAAGCLLILRAHSIGSLIPCLPLIGLGMGFFWPPIQAALADEGSLKQLDGNIGMFNVFWSSGKAMGFLVGGTIYAWFGAGPIFLIGSAVMLLMMGVIPGKRLVAAEDPEKIPVEYERASPADLKAFLRMAWVANAVAFGLGHTMNTQYPKFLLEIGRGPQSFGIYLCGIFAVQTLSFYFLRSFGGWKFRRFPVYAVQIVMGAAVLLVPFLRPFGLIVLTALPLGLGLGLAYHASITYSLASHSGRGERAGIHEALLGAGNLVLPFCGGLLASATGDLRMPYWFCAAAVAACLVGQEILWRRRGR